MTDRYEKLTSLAKELKNSLYEVYRKSYSEEIKLKFYEDLKKLFLKYELSELNFEVSYDTIKSSYTLEGKNMIDTLALSYLGSILSEV